MSLLRKSGEIVSNARSGEIQTATSLVMAAQRAIIPLRLVEKRAIESALILHEGRVVPAAERLGISAQTLRSKIRIYRAEDDGEVRHRRVMAATAS